MPAATGLEYPLSPERQYRLWELDGSNVRLITGLSYEELRDIATIIGNDHVTYGDGGKVVQNMFAPWWDKVLNTSAEDYWYWRQDNPNVHPAQFWTNPHYQYVAIIYYPKFSTIPASYHIGCAPSSFHGELRLLTRTQVRREIFPRICEVCGKDI